MDRKTTKKNLLYSIFDGTFYSIMVGFGESFFMAFGVFLKANIFEQGLIGSLPQSLGYFFEIFSDRLLRIIKSRKLMVLIGAFIQGIMYIPVMLIFLFGGSKIPLLILFISLYWIVGMIISPPWNSWMSDIVPVKERGRYFGRRTKIAGVASFVAYIFGGLLLQWFGGQYQYLGYALIFGIAFVSRMVSFSFLLKQDEPEYKIPAERYKFRHFVSSLFKSNFGTFTLYMFILNFSVQIAAPFFIPYMLNDLKMDYITLTVITATSMLVKYMSMPGWGKIIDTYGARIVLKFTGYLIPIVPIMWAFSANFYYLMFAQVLSGFIWSGFELASVNFMFDTTPYDKRAAMIAYYNVVYGVSNISGALLGSWIATLPFIFSGYKLLFVVSGLLRFAAPLIFVHKIEEEREVPALGYDKLLFKIMTIRPTRGFLINIIPIPRRPHKKK
ncbi:TPA: MFS transporter [Candidatus Woesearchaeota archaeon]|nr:hypothetical protein QT06_C0001G1218 [archaeon GW2011_AR15]MBS3104318.1 MFS transporter [Candidatus Woesearchaeota archaeon]HIH41884.1 MFS transporter [Candidatus Woesearchaeota archaeon]